MKNTYFFSHDANARNDEKILALMARCGTISYAVYWILIEMMFESSNSKLSIELIDGISFSYNIDITLLQNIITSAIKLKLFDTDDEYIWSESLIKRKEYLTDYKAKKSEAGKAGMAKRWGTDNTVITNDNTVITKHNKLNKTKLNKTETIKDIYIPFAENVSLKEEEHKKLLETYPQATVDKMIQVLDNYKGSSGKKYKSDYRAILSWVAEKVTKEEQPKQPIANKPNRVTKFHTSESRTSKYSAADLDKVAERKRAEHSAKKVIE